MSYTGRFAPSPTGTLHFGSLVAALGSYLQAKSQKGKWLVRIEDCDPPREQSGASKNILFTLEHFGLFWDDEVLFQSSRAARYHEILSFLHEKNLLYQCDCSRRRIHAIGGFYDGHCRAKKTTTPPYALRFRQSFPFFEFDDQLCGKIIVPPEWATEDFVLFRKEQLFAYALAVVVDDHDQKVTEVVRGADLLLPTARQLSLYRALEWQAPEFLHLPLVFDQNGQKLSKQNLAPPVSSENPTQTLAKALKFLGQHLPPDWQDAKKEEIIDFAVKNWNLDAIPRSAANHC